MPLVKALIAGSCGGNVEALLKRVSTVHSSKGPFDVLFCVGQFFAKDGDDGAEYVGPLTEYIRGNKTLPLPICFIGNWGQGAASFLSQLEASNNNNGQLRYLGRAGVTEVKGLSVAFLDGTFHAAAFEDADSSTNTCRYYTRSDVELLKSSIAAHEGDIDLLLTNEWPEGIGEGLPPGALPDSAPKSGSCYAAEVAAARPRYHIAAGADAFLARQPYLNKDLGAGAHVTRFLALAPVANASKQKWLHALALTPASEMDPEQLHTVPPGTTPDPYSAAAARRRKREVESASEGGQDWRWQDRSKKARMPMAAPSLGRPDLARDRRRTIFVRNVPFAATENTLIEFFSQAGKVEDVVRKTNDQGRLNTWCHVQFSTVEEMERACQLNGSELMGRKLEIDASSMQKRSDGNPVEGCWFCLSNASADVDLIASVGEEAYLALDKGAITDNHILIVSIEHHPSSQVVSTDCFAEVERYREALRSCFAAEGKELVGFERYMALRKSGGNHCHLNAIAVERSSAGAAAEVFDQAAAAAGFQLERIPPAGSGESARKALRDLVGDGEYFQAILPDGSRLVHPIAYGERHPLNFGREVLAKLVGQPERADWKACAVPVDEERARTERFKAKFKPFDIMQDDAA